jgi:hypothetical protein
MPFPYQMDEFTTIVNVTAEPNAVRYHYELSGVDVSLITEELLKNNLLSSICKNTVTKDLIDRDIDMEYYYLVKTKSGTKMLMNFLMNHYILLLKF